MREKLHEIIFGTTTKAGKLFDVILLIVILLFTASVMLQTIPGLSETLLFELQVVEWVFAFLFLIEYLLRIYISPKPLKYIFSWWGLIDFISIVPTFISPLIHGYESLRVFRALRLFRVFRILQLSRFNYESRALALSLKASYYKIMVFFFFIVMMMLVTGTAMYVIEDGRNGFESIPSSIYWAVTTTTTVGYGDITPATGLGKTLATLMMLTGYAIIAIPTGLVSVEIYKNKDLIVDQLKTCSNCGHLNSADSSYCNQCGTVLTKSGDD